MSQKGAQGTVAAGQRLATVFLIPAAKLEVGGHYQVRGTNAITDVDVPPKNLIPTAIEFDVANYKDLGTFPLPAGTVVKRVAVLGGRTFVAATNRIYFIRVGGATTSTLPIPAFGITGSGGNDFLGQEITEMKVFRQVPVQGSPVDLLLVTTSPAPGDSNRQGVLWAFNACSGLTTPKLLFAVSLGPGVVGYAPTLDCEGGFITVGRVASSVAVISVDAGVQGWNDPLKGNRDIGAAISPGGNNAQAIVQPFYLANPEGTHSYYHPGVAMVPSETDATGGLAPYLHIVAGFADASILRDSKSMRGLPNVFLPMVTGSTGVLKLERPYEPLSGSDHPGDLEPDRRAFPVPLTKGAAGGRVAVLPNLPLLNPDGTSRQASLAFAWSGMDSGNGGNSLVVVDESIPRTPTDGSAPRNPVLGKWPTGPLGLDESQRPLPYELPFVTPSVDALTGLMALPVKLKGGIQWFVLDFHRPDQPKIVARVPVNGQFGSLNNGILSVATATGVEVKKIVEGVKGVDSGDCALFLPTALVLEDIAASTGEGESGLQIKDIRVQLDEGSMVDLKDCDWLLVKANARSVFVNPSALVSEVLAKLTLKLKSGTTPGIHKVGILATDAAGNPINISPYSFTDFWNGKPAEIKLETDGR